MAVEDLRKVNELASVQKGEDILYDFYIQNTLKDIAKLDNIKSTIQSLRENNKLPLEFLDAFDSLTNVTATLCVTVGDHTEQLKKLWSMFHNITTKLSEHKEITDNDYQIIREELKRHDVKITQQNIEIENKVQKDEIEPYTLKVSAEIVGNDKLNCYYEALYDKLHSAMKEAEIITAGHVALHTSDIKVTALSAGLKLIPVAGKYIASGFEAGATIIKSNNIKSQAIKFKQILGLNPDNRAYVLKKTAEKITIDKKQQIEDIENDQEVLNWHNKGLITKCKDFFIVNMNDKT